MTYAKYKWGRVSANFADLDTTLNNLEEQGIEIFSVLLDSTDGLYTIIYKWSNKSTPRYD